MAAASMPTLLPRSTAGAPRPVLWSWCVHHGTATTEEMAPTAPNTEAVTRIEGGQTLQSIATVTMQVSMRHSPTKTMFRSSVGRMAGHLSAAR